MKPSSFFVVLFLGIVPVSMAKGAVELTTEASMKENMSGKNAFVKFLAPW